MNILQLTIEDVKRVSAISISPETGKPVVLTGDNAQGKSSVLDAIELLLTNRGLEDPIRHGAQSARVSCKIGGENVEFTVTRKLTRRGDTLEIIGADGVKVPSPQRFLSGLIGTYAFDPLEFSRMGGTTDGRRKQADTLRQLAGLDFSALDAERAAIFSERTDIGRRGKEAAAQLEGIVEPLPNTPDEEQSTADLLSTLDHLRARKNAARVAEAEYDAVSESVASASAKVERIKSELAAAEQELVFAKDRQTEKRLSFAGLEEASPTDNEIGSAEDSIRNVDSVNAAVRDKKRRSELASQVDDLRRQYSEKTASIEAIDEDKRKRIKNADLPLDGLELNDDGVIYHGTRFDQLSTAEQIRISTLVAIAQNPRLRIVMIREGALVNRENMAMIAGLAAEHGSQLWVEKFQEEPGDVGLHIVDGSVAFVDGKEVAP